MDLVVLRLMSVGPMTLIQSVKVVTTIQALIVQTNASKFRFYVTKTYLLFFSCFRCRLGSEFNTKAEECQVRKGIFQFENLNKIFS